LKLQKNIRVPGHGDGVLICWLVNNQYGGVYGALMLRNAADRQLIANECCIDSTALSSSCWTWQIELQAAL